MKCTLNVNGFIGERAALGNVAPAAAGEALEGGTSWGRTCQETGKCNKEESYPEEVAPAMRK